MAILKTLQGIEHKLYRSLSGSTSYTTSNDRIYSLPTKNFALLEDPSSSVMYFADSTNDSVSMAPYFDKNINFGNSFKSNLRHGFCNNMIFTSRPKINARFDYLSTDADDDELLSSQIMSNTFRNNADLASAYNRGNYTRFTKGTETYSLFVLQTQNGFNPMNGTYSSAPYSEVLLVKGTDFSNAQYISKSDLPFNGNMNLLSVNVDEQIIYLLCTQSSAQNFSNATTSERYPADVLVALPFRTIAENQAFEFATPKELLRTGSNDQEFFSNGSPMSIVYMGQDSSDDDCFMFVENIRDITGVTNSNALAIIFAKINYTNFATATTYTDVVPNSMYELLDCFDKHTVTLNANPANNTDYSDQHNAIPSKFYNFDQANPNDLVAYLPMFRNNGNFTPIAIEWDNAEAVWASAFTITEDLLSNVSVDGAVNGDTTASIANPRAVLDNASIANYSGSYSCYMSAFLSSSNSLHFLFNYKETKVYNDIVPATSTLLNNCLSFGVNTTTPTTLTYENIQAIGALDSLLLKDYANNTYNELVVIKPDALEFYTYSVANGWTSSQSVDGFFTEFSMDSYSRRWALQTQLRSQATDLVAPATGTHYQMKQYDVKLHLISQVLPYTTSVAFGNTNVTYSGTPVSNTLVVNAYDENASRIAVDVLLNIEGSNMVFAADNSTSTTITTSAAQDTTVNVSITGAGFISVSASFDV